MKNVIKQKTAAYSKGIMALLGGISLLSIGNVEGVGAKPSTFAVPQDAFSGATNPALEVFVGDRVDGCARWFHNPLHSHTYGNAVPGVNGHYNAAKRKDFYFGEGAIAKTFQTCICCKSYKWSLGFAYYTDNFLYSQYNRPYRLFGTTPFGARVWRQIFAPIFAFQINEQHSIGVSIDVALGRTFANGFQNFDKPAESVAPGYVTNKGYSYAWGASPAFGWRWGITKTFALGLYYRPKIKMSKFHKYKGLVPQHGQTDVAQRVGIGFSNVFTEKLAGALDFEWNNLRSVQLGNRLLNWQGKVNKGGARNGPYHGYKDMYIVRCGLGYKIDDMWTVRAGYQHISQIIPSSQTIINLDTCYTVQNYLTVNSTWTWCSNEITVLYSHGFKNKIKGHHSIPQAFGGGEADISDSKDTVAINWGYKF